MSQLCGKGLTHMHPGNLCSLIFMIFIDSADESTFCFTVQWHEYTCSGIINTNVKIQHKGNNIQLMVVLSPT